jgi:ligand-binding sensor domain-containing protein/signal transduction histidine kinase
MAIARCNNDLHRSGFTTVAETLRLSPGLQVASIDSDNWPSPRVDFEVSEALGKLLECRPQNAQQSYVKVPRLRPAQRRAGRQGTRPVVGGPQQRPGHGRRVPPRIADQEPEARIVNESCFQNHRSAFFPNDTPESAASSRHRRLRIGPWAGALILCLGIPRCGFALDPAKSVQHYNCQTWNRQTGLPANGINAIAQTKDGYLWLGTAAGLVRFDGLEFKLLDLARVPQVRNSIVTSLASARDGGLWVGLENSAFGFYHGHAFSFRGKAGWGRLDMNVRSILESRDGTLWLAAERQASRLAPSGVYEEVLGSSADAAINILSGYQDAHGRVWFGTANQGVHYWRAGKIAKLPDPALDSTLVFSVAEDLEGRIWVGTATGLYCYDSNLQRETISPLVAEIRALLVDRRGVLWIGTSGHGLMRFQDGAYSSFRKSDGLASDYVKALAEDREGSLWIGTRDGVSQLTDVKFPTLPAAEDASVRDALAVGASRKGGLWVGSSAGVTYLDDKVRTYSTEAGLPNPFVKRVFEAGNGDLYLVSGSSDIVVLSGGKAVAVHSAPSMVVGMAEDPQGVVVSVGGSLYRAGTDFLSPYAFTNGAPPLQWILNLAPGRDGAIWIASVNGICRVRGGGYRLWTAEQGLSDPRVQGICEDSEGIVWAALLTGIARLKDDQIRCISRKDGLFDDNIYAIVPDDFGNLWVDSGRGIFRVSREGMNEFADGRSGRVQCVAHNDPQSVKPADKTIQERIAAKTLDGRIWFPGANGVVVIDPARIPTNPIPPPVHIERVRANGSDFERNRSAVVPPGKGELEFHFTALSFIAPQNLRFRYQLEGYDQDWVETQDRRLAFYTNLKPGRYIFRVAAANADGIWNASGDALELELLPHFYQTVWFYFLCGGVSLAALLGIYAGRVRHLERRQQALQRTRGLLEIEVLQRTSQLAETNTSLEREVQERTRAEAQLKQRTEALENEIEERQQVQLEVERVHRELLETSRRAGMAEVATGVLHNVGNVLNSVNVASGCIAESLRNSKSARLSKVVALLREHEADMGAFLTTDPKGRQVPNYLAQLADHLGREQSAAIEELSLLQKNIEHIKDIVTMQQSYAKVSGVRETLQLADLVEDALRMNSSSLARHDVQVVKEFQNVPAVLVEKHKVLQILVNVVRNAKHACEDSARHDKQITLRVTNGEDRVRVVVSDNGVGIPAENLTRIFAHGFTTRKDGHGFGLHSGALAAREMGGALLAHSDGPGKGATFTLEFPVQSK